MCDSSTRPAFIPVPNVAKVTMHYQLNLQEVENVHYFQKGDSWSSADLTDLTNVIEGAWVDNIMPQQPADLQLKYIEAVDQERAGSFFDRRRVDTFGGLAQVSLPGNVTLSIKFDGGLVGRSHRGRMYWLQLAESQVVGDLVQTTPLGQILGGVEAFFEDIKASALAPDHVVVSYCQEGAWLTEGDTTVITSYSSDGIVDSQRRRLTGRGR